MTSITNVVLNDKFSMCQGVYIVWLEMIFHTFHICMCTNRRTWFCMYTISCICLCMWMYSGGWFLVCWGGRGACSKCTLGHREGMISQRCSSPQHSAIMPWCWSSRGIQACCASSSQVMMVSYLSKSNKDMYCIEILYKYDHNCGKKEGWMRCICVSNGKRRCRVSLYMYALWAIKLKKTTNNYNIPDNIQSIYIMQGNYHHYLDQ